MPAILGGPSEVLDVGRTPAPGHPRHPGSTRTPRRWLCVPRLRHTRKGLRSPPHHPLATRRPNRPVEPRPALRPPPRHHRTQPQPARRPLESPTPGRRHTRNHPATPRRPQPTTTTPRPLPHPKTRLASGQGDGCAPSVTSRDWIAWGSNRSKREFDRFSRRWLCALVAVLSIVFAACTPGAASTPPAGTNPYLTRAAPRLLRRSRPRLRPTSTASFPAAGPARRTTSPSPTSRPTSARSASRPPGCTSPTTGTTDARSRPGPPPGSGTPDRCPGYG